MRNQIAHLCISDYFTQPIDVRESENGFTIFVMHEQYGLNTDIDVELLSEILLEGFTLNDIQLNTSHFFEESNDVEMAYAISFSL